MKISSVTIRIDNFDNSAMADNSSLEVVQILQSIINRIQQNGVANCDRMRLMDSNGNAVGILSVEENDDEDE